MEGIPNGVGLSIFQGSTPLQLDPGAENELEDEAVADQQRRDQELQKLLTNAFDDLCDDIDDCSTISSIHANSDRYNEDREEIVHNNVVARYHAAMFPEKGLLGNTGTEVYRYPASHLNDSVGSRVGAYINSVNVPRNTGPLQNGETQESSSILHYQHCYRTSPNGRVSNDFGANDNERFRQAGFGSAEQFQVLYEVRVREVERLTHQLETLAEEASREKEDLQRKIAFGEAEKEQAQLLYKQAQSLLVESKEKIADLERRNLDLEAKVKSLESSKADLSDKLEASRLSVEDLHQKIVLLERGNLNNTDKHLDSFLHNVQAMHGAQMKKIEDELALAVSRLNSKETELEQQKQESQRRQQQLEACLAEKGDIVNQLARSLEEAQRQCQTFMTQNSAQEVVHLKMKLNATEKECATLTERLQTNQRETEILRSDIKQYEAFLKEELMADSSDWESEHQSSGGLSNKSHLHGELQRALLGLKLKREEIEQLQSQLKEHSKEVEQLRKQEEQNKLKLLECQNDSQKHKHNLLEANRHLEKQNAELSELKEKLIEEESRTAKAVQEGETQKITLMASQEECKQLKEEINSLKKKIELANGLHNCSEDNLRIHEEKFAQSLEQLNKEHNDKIQTLRMELEQARKETDSVKELYIKVCHSKQELSSTLHKDKNNIKELEDKVEELKTQLERSKNSPENSDDLKTMRDSLESEKNRADKLQEKNQLLLEKLEEGKENLDAAHKAIAQSVLLKEQLLAKENEIKDITNRYNEDLKNLLLEKDQAIQELEKSKEMFATKVTDEIEKAKAKALEELKTHRKDSLKDEDGKSKIKQYEEELSSLQERLQTAVRRHAEDTATLSHHLQQAKVREEKLYQALRHKEEELGKLKQLMENNLEQSVGSADQGQKEMKIAFASKLKAVQSQNQINMQEACERVKEETMRFCIQQIRLAETKFIANIKKSEEEHEKEVNNLKCALKEKEVELSKCEEKLKNALSQLENEKLNQNRECELKAKLQGLEEELKDIERKAEKTEKSLEVTKAKYQAAKRAVYKYKKYTEAQQKHLEKEWERINAGFQHTLSQVQNKLTKLAGQETE